MLINIDFYWINCRLEFIALTVIITLHWISRSHLMSLCRSIPFVLRKHLLRTDDYVCTMRNTTRCEVKCPRICIAFEKSFRRDLLKLLEEMCRNELFIVLCLKITLTTWPHNSSSQNFTKNIILASIFFLYITEFLLQILQKVLHIS